MIFCGGLLQICHTKVPGVKSEPSIGMFQWSKVTYMSPIYFLIVTYMLQTASKNPCFKFWTVSWHQWSKSTYMSQIHFCIYIEIPTTEDEE